MVWSTKLQANSKSIIALGKRCLRSIHSSSRRFESSKKPGTGSEVGSANQQANVGATLRAGGNTKTVPTWLDKRYLVWSKYYKSVDEVPGVVDWETIKRARSYGTIRTNLGCIVIGLIGAMLFVYLGKQDAARGDNINKQNLEWHKKINEDYEKSKKA